MQLKPGRDLLRKHHLTINGSDDCQTKITKNIWRRSYVSDVTNPDTKVDKDEIKDSFDEEGIAKEYIQAISSEKDF
ncbi:uncharacterized protein FIBRA_09221 [Fibroporia radiculosa]|uniref:Uncharacterized protein n=1 Tax=Fibroporia radiculosa TaxID=599839 RepID=J7RVK3_9APHY|nr:uncharacterized protein FIBRA_09221 [Fibroporia radiculosa]CCM06910.1 predicted protein [Fibroporia radiculosa]